MFWDLARRTGSGECPPLHIESRRARRTVLRKGVAGKTKRYPVVHAVRYNTTYAVRCRTVFLRICVSAAYYQSKTCTVFCVFAYLRRITSQKLWEVTNTIRGNNISRHTVPTSILSKFYVFCQGICQLTVFFLRDKHTTFYGRLRVLWGNNLW